MSNTTKSSEKRPRRHFTGPQKTAIVKAHLVDGMSVADLCDEHQIQPIQFYLWQKQLFGKTKVSGTLKLFFLWNSVGFEGDRT